MPMQSAKRITWTALALGLLVLAGCASDRPLGSDPVAPARAEPAPRPTPPEPEPPPVNMAGRWLLASADGALCGMNFTAAPGAPSGKIAPEGGCPGNLFTSRQWAFEQGALVIYDHKQQPLARLATSEPPGRFEGTAVSGIPINLRR
jgi:hypothetical protein